MTAALREVVFLICAELALQLKRRLVSAAFEG